jgi:hypothetical protein
MLDLSSLEPEHPPQYLDLSEYPDFETSFHGRFSGLMIKHEVYTPWNIKTNGKPRRQAPIIQENKEILNNIARELRQFCPGTNFTNFKTVRVVKKINGQQKFLHYAIINHETGEFHSLKQEYTTMSRRPGIAADWFAKYSQI